MFRNNHFAAGPGNLILTVKFPLQAAVPQGRPVEQSPIAAWNSHGLGGRWRYQERFAMTASTIILILVILLLIGAVPAWPYSRGWGYGPSGILGLVLLVLIILLLMGRL
jgi:hypothetical protein